MDKKQAKELIEAYIYGAEGITYSLEDMDWTEVPAEVKEALQDFGNRVYSAIDLLRDDVREMEEAGIVADEDVEGDDTWEAIRTGSYEPGK